MYDWLIVGCGLYAAVAARELMDAGKSVLIIDKREHIGGNVFTRRENGIDIHVYGGHIFHTNSRAVWEYVQRFAAFNNYVHRVKARTVGSDIYSLPINLMTFYQIAGCRTPQEAKDYLKKVCVPGDESTAEGWCLANIGRPLYEKLIKGYTTKQWGRSPAELPASIVRRLPVRLTFDDNYHASSYQGIPVNGYTEMVKNMIDGADVRLGVTFTGWDEWSKYARNLIYTGPIDKFFGHCHGKLEYRSLRFDHRWHEGDFQGAAQVNYCSELFPQTRTIEHKHFAFGTQDKTCVTTEYPAKYEETEEAYYPVNDAANQQRYAQYRALVPPDVVVGGRLGEYRYYDMDQVVASALRKVRKDIVRTACGD